MSTTLLCHAAGVARRAGRRQNESMALVFTTSYLEDVLAILRYQKRLGERAMAQISDDDLIRTPAPESNSIATIVKHLSGNFVSRWTDFLTTDGEKPTRDRGVEFETPPQTRDEIMARWETGWGVLLGSLASLTEADLGRTVLIRGERLSVLQAVNRAMTHCCYHIGQIVFLAKQFAGDRWNSLTIPRGTSKEYHARVASGEVSQR